MDTTGQGIKERPDCPAITTDPSLTAGVLLYQAGSITVHLVIGESLAPITFSYITAMDPASVTASVTFKDELIESQVLFDLNSQVIVVHAGHLKISGFPLGVLAGNFTADCHT